MLTLAVLTLGDTQYETGTLSAFQQSYNLPGRELSLLPIQQLETTNTLLPVHQAITATLLLLAASQKLLKL